MQRCPLPRFPRLAVVASFLLALLGTRSALADANGEWRGIAPAPGRTEHVAVYDATHDRLVVVLGVYDKNALNTSERDVWARSFTPFGGWQQVVASGTPSFGPVSGEMVYDSQRDRFVMASGSTLTIFDLSGSGAWSTTPIAGTPPSSRFAPSFTYDAGNDRIVCFGGDGDSLLNDVWSVNLSGTPTWVQITPSGTPPTGRSSANVVYDPAGARMIVCGGDTGVYHAVPDVWALSLGGAPAWTDITPSVPGPSSRDGAAVVLDPVHNRMLMQGGSDPDARLWALDLGGIPSWSVIATTGAVPGSRSGHTLSYDASRDRVLIYGGSTDVPSVYPSYPSADLRALDLATGVWTDLVDTRPSPRHGHTAVYDAPRQRMVMFGGGSYAGEGQNETWSLSLGAQMAWSNLAPSGSPSSFENHTAIVDPIRQRMLAFSAYPSGAVWSFDLAGDPAWTLLSTAGTPPGWRYWHVAVYDPNGDRMVVFGGTNNSNFLADVWQLTLSGTPTWTQLSPTGSAPGALFRPAAIYDPVGGRMLIVGSTSAQGFRAKVWSLSLTGPPTWTLLAPAGTGPQDCGSYAAAYDDSRQRMLVFSGGAGCNTNSTSTYALSLTGPLQWTLLAPVGVRPVTRCGPSAIYDSADDRMVIYGGEWCNGVEEAVDMDSAWQLEFGTTVSTPMAALPVDLQLFPAVPNPASGDVTLAFALPRAGSVRLAIYDLAGRKVAEVFSGPITAGRHEVRWTRVSRDAAGLSAGVYFSELRVGNQRAARRMVVTR